MSLRRVICLAAVLIMGLPAVHALAQYGGGGRGTGGTRGPIQPPPENPVLVEDRKKIVEAQNALAAANGAYTAAVGKFTIEYEKKTEYVDARKAVDEATRSMDIARRAVIDRLKVTNSKYKSLVQQEIDIGKQLDRMRADGGSRDAISTLSTDRFRLSGEIGKLDAEALEKDVPYQDAKRKFTEVSAVLAALKDKLPDAIKDDANLTSLKTRRESAQATLEAARKKFEADRATQN